MDEKKIHNREFQLKGIGGINRYKLLQKRFTGKTTEFSKHLRKIAIEKYILRDPPPQQYTRLTKIKISNPPSKYFSEIFNRPRAQAGGGEGCMP